ncbi:DUF2058 family protein [Pseudoxanthomonas sp. 10H]|uniref:DUF2058 family protein n=1 Tax=Pseudoxanthomonas sp. 10H TaxID=3242729 RepID=UPI00355605A2
MTDSLRDQLLNLGFKKSAPEPARKPAAGKGGQGRPPQRGGRPGAQDAAKGRPAGGNAPRRDPGRKPAGEMDLGKAWALRANQEKQQRIDAERVKQEEARVRREAKARLELLLKDKALNDPAADIARHFEYGGKIKRIYVTGPQLKALNGGELGVVQLNGRYLLVDAAALAEAEAAFAPAVALKVDPAAPAGEDPYADPRYQVPDDLVW